MINFIKTLAPFLGILYCIFIIIFLILSTPVYLFRAAVIYLAKISRPDLGDILGGQTAVFLGDYWAKTPPRSNVVFAFIFEGQLKIDEIQARVMKKWIQVDDKSSFENFQRYPDKWLGFIFWKDASDAFSIQKHVKVHKCSEEEKQVTDKQLTKIMESLLNQRTAQFQSPWTLQLVENYQHPSVQAGSTEERKQHSALIFQWHHILVDGVGAMTALVEALFEQHWIRKAEAPLPERKGWRNLLHALTLPTSAVSILSWFLAHSFRESPFKISDERKEWHQVLATSGLIKIGHIKNIKNAFDVSYTSVLLSAISVAVHRTLGNVQAEKVGSLLCSCTLLARGVTKRKILANHMTTALFELPCDKFANPVERLKIVHQRLQCGKESVIPNMVVPLICTLIGSHTHAVNSNLMDNQMVAIGLTNFAGVPKNIQLDKNTTWVHTKFTGGLFTGVQGANIATISHGGQMEIFVCVERALMSTEEAEMFVHHIKEEIENLRDYLL